MKSKRPKQSVFLDAASDETTEPRFHCTQCRKSCSGTPYSFGGGFACESCARAYYQNMYPDMSDADIAEELRYRQYEASQITGKQDTGDVTPDEVDYCLRDVKCTVEVLNAAKSEYDLHPIAKRPDQLFSPASVAKGYMDELKILYPSKKFKKPGYAFGIAMQGYYGGRAECRIRKCEVPVVPVDFMSQYPTVNELLGNWQVLTAESISFEDATAEVRHFLKRITLEQCFDRKLWPKFKFFALVRPDRNILPVRTLYNGVTQNIGINYLTSEQPLWFAGPDIISAIILSDSRVPHIEKAYRVVPHKKQSGLGTTNLRSMVKVDAAEGKSLGPDGKPCEFDTRGLLQRSHIVSGEHIPIGKESDRHWEQGEDVSLWEFKATQYKRRGKVTATNDQLQRIAQVSKKELRRRGINQHTLEKICRKEAVRVSKLTKVLKVLQRWESESLGGTEGE